MLSVVLLTVIVCVCSETSSHPFLDGDVRLADREFGFSDYRQSQSGRVEIFYNSTWGTVCMNGWSQYETQTVCTEIGLGRKLSWRRVPHNKLARENVPILLDYVYCDGEERLSECRRDDFYQVRDSCTHHDDVWVGCYRTMPTPVTGYNLEENNYENEHRVPHAGLVQAKLDGDWSYLSADGWDEGDASIACQQLGFPAVNSIPSYDARAVFLPEEYTGAIMRQLDCLGYERELRKCYHQGWETLSTQVNQLAAVDCTTRSQYLDNKLNLFRLRGSNNYWEGRLEVLHNYRWGTVCSTGFSLSHADRACKSLGLGRAQKVITTADGGYGRGGGVIWLGDFDCSNSDTDSLLDCEHSPWSHSSCGYDHARDVSIRCAVPRPEKMMRVWTQTGSAIPGVRWYFTELYHEDRWIAPCCSTLYTQVNMDILCRDLGLGFGILHINRCQKVPRHIRRSGVNGILYCPNNEYFSEQCLRIFSATEECPAGYDLIACADSEFTSLLILFVLSLSLSLNSG